MSSLQHPDPPTAPRRSASKTGFCSTSLWCSAHWMRGTAVMRGNVRTQTFKQAYRPKCLAVKLNDNSQLLFQSMWIPSSEHVYRTHLLKMKCRSDAIKIHAEQRLIQASVPLKLGCFISRKSIPPCSTQWTRSYVVPRDSVDVMADSPSLLGTKPYLIQV